MAVEAQAPASNLPWQAAQYMNDSRCDITNKREVKVKQKRKEFLQDG